MATLPASSEGMTIAGNGHRKRSAVDVNGDRILGGGGRRGIIEDLQSPFPLAPAMPALYQEDPFTQRFLQTFDAALAPLFATIDCFPAYLDSQVTPEDFLPWLASWVGVLLDETWPIERRRNLVRDAVSLFTMRGTVVGMKRLINLYTGGEVEIDDGGGTVLSTVPEGELPGYPSTSFVVRVTIPRGARVQNRRIESLIAAAKPAHLTHRLEVVQDAPALSEPLPVASTEAPLTPAPPVAAAAPPEPEPRAEPPSEPPAGGGNARPDPA